MLDRVDMGLAIELDVDLAGFLRVVPTGSHHSLTRYPSCLVDRYSSASGRRPQRAGGRPSASRSRSICPECRAVSPIM